MTPSPPAKPRVDGWKFRWDVVVLLAFVLAAMRHWTDLPWHEVLGAAVVPVLAVHLWLNWKWIVDVFRRSTRSRPGEVRFNRAWDLAQCAVAGVAIGTGLAVSRNLLPALGIAPGRHRFLEDVHAFSAWALMTMIGVHLGVHAHWIWSKVRRPRFALVVVVLVMAVAGVTRLDIVRRNGAFSRRFRGDAIQVAMAIVPSGLVAFGALVVFRRRRPNSVPASG